MTGDFVTNLKHGLGAEPQDPWIFLGNFEVEKYWAGSLSALPSVSSAASDIIVNRMDEMAILLASENDYVVVKGPLDPRYAAYLRSLDIGLPRTIELAATDPRHSVAVDLAEAPANHQLLRTLREHDPRVRFMPLGVSPLEERVSAATSIPLAVPGSDVFRRVNSKIYSRQCNAALGLRQVPGFECDSLAEFSAGLPRVREWLDAGETAVIKDAYGVSGKGLYVVKQHAQLDRLHKLMVRQASTAGVEVHVVVEQWIAKRCDLNYQFTVRRDGRTTFDFVKEALTENGVHKGHVFPARLSPAQLQTIEGAAALLGQALHAGGYTGVVGVDAIVGADETLYPNLEINARFNMSTFQVNLQRRFVRANQVALACYYPLRLSDHVPFSNLLDVLWDHCYTLRNRRGLLVNCFATLNAAYKPGCAFDGRLYGLVIGNSYEDVATLDRTLKMRLRALERSAA